MHNSETRPGCQPRWRRGFSILGIALSLASPVSASNIDAIHFILDAPNLSSALIQLSTQSGLSVVFSDQAVRNLPAPEVIGSMPTAEALDTLLRGSNLEWELVDNQVIAVFATDCSTRNSTCPGPRELIERYPVYIPGLEETYVYGSRVTGTRIRRSNYTGGAPIDILSSPDIELSGAQTIGELLKFVPAVSGNSLSTAISNGGDGTATVTLRGLPASNTLVLINGRRVANDGLAGDAVDLNSIPPAAVERIEILKDGASAIYGSDAIAGVVNVIMKRDFHGFLAEGYQGQSREGDLETSTYTLQYGTGLRDGSLFISASSYMQDPIFSRDRSVSRSADTRRRGGTDQRSSATPNARVTLPSGESLIANGSGYRPATGEDLFDYQAFTTAVVPLERNSLYGNASYDFSESVTGMLEFSFVKTEADATLAPTPVFTAFEQTPLVTSAESIFNPFGTDIADVRRRLVEFPARRQKNDAEAMRFAAVMEGLVRDWNWDLSYSWSRSEATETTTGIVNAERLGRAIGPAAQCRGPDIDGCVPVDLLGPAGSIGPAQVQYIAAQGSVSGYSKLSSFMFNVSNEFDFLPVGRTNLAVGVEHRLESTSKRPSRLLNNTGTIGATNFQPTSGDRRVSEIYFEALQPLWESANELYALDLEAAIRFSNYSDFGSTTNPRAGLRFQAGPSLLLRGNYSEGFRAPSLNELYQGNSENQAFISDPCTLPANVGVLPGCSALADGSRNQFLTVSGGNEDLEPETSESFSLGVVWTPASVAGLAMSVDYFQIDQEDVVSSSAQFIVNQNAFRDAFPDRVSRDIAGNLVLVESQNINIGERKVSGADFALTWHLPRGPWGQLTVTGGATWIDEYLARLDTSAPQIDFAGTFRDEASEGLGGIPEWKSQVGLRWNRDRWQGSYQIHYIDGLEEEIPGTSSTREIDAWTVHDIQASYTFAVADGLRLTLGVDNVFDEPAPLAASAFNDNIDGRTHELKGRFFYTKLGLRL